MDEHTKKEIDKIIKRRYDNYKSAFGRRTKILHDFIRTIVDDEKFLSLLEQAETENPKPFYKLPEKYKWHEANFFSAEPVLASDRPRLIKRIDFGSNIFLCEKNELWRSIKIKEKLMWIYYGNVTPK